MKKAALLVASMVLIAGCATPVSHTAKPMTQHDKDTEYAIEDSPEGFNLTVLYSRYQFIPESSAVATGCKSALTSIAWDVAKKRSREIKPVNEQQIRLSMGRNGFSGITSCSANAPVEWLK